MPSTVIAHFRYDPVSMVLEVEFISGLVYKYLGVPPMVYEAMKASRAKGIYLNKHIKGFYEYKKVESL